MKVPPKRKGNQHVNLESVDGGTLNESPSEKEGKYKDLNTLAVALLALNESPSEKEGKCKRPGRGFGQSTALNESPSEKEGKLVCIGEWRQNDWPSMKVPPKRKGNLFICVQLCYNISPSMKVPPKRKGNSYPKIARNHAAETVLRENLAEATRKIIHSNHIYPRITPWQGKKPCERHAMFPSRTRFSLTQRPPPGAS